MNLKGNGLKRIQLFEFEDESSVVSVTSKDFTTNFKTIPHRTFGFSGALAVFNGLGASGKAFA